MNNNIQVVRANMPQLKQLLLPVFFVVATSIHSGSSAQQASQNDTGSYRPQVGQQHPDFALPEIKNGEKTSLAQFRGKKLLLLHFASW